MKIFDYDVFCFDVDGTIAPTYEKIQPEMADALCTLLHKGKTLLFVTGRGMYVGSLEYDNVVRGVIAQLSCFDTYSDHVYIIAAGGAVLYKYSSDSKTWKELYAKHILKDTLHQLETVYREALMATVSQDDPVHTFTPRFVYREDFSVACTSIDPASAPQELRKEWDRDYHKRRVIVSYMKERIQGVSFSIGGGTTIDVTSEGVNKASGIEQFFSHTGFNKHQTVFLGDGFGEGGNDEIVKQTGVAVYEVSGPQEVLHLLEQHD